MSEKKKTKWREYVETFIIALLIALFVRTFVIQAFKIPSGSMVPTLLVGDHLLVNKFIYGTRIPLVGKKLFVLRKPRRGDVIVFIYPRDRSKDFIKRVIGLEGEKVEIKEQKIYINDRLIDDPLVEALRFFHGVRGCHRACSLLPEVTRKANYSSRWSSKNLACE